MAKAKVAALKVRPETILSDVVRLCELAGMKGALAGGATTILKDNISWHYPFPAANTTPWQLEGTVLALQAAGLADLACVQNKTVVTNAFKGEDLNHYVPIFRQYGIPVLYNFKEADMKWIDYRPQARMHVLDRIFPDGIRIPDYFVGKNVVHLPTMKCVAGETEVVLADGSIATVASLFERAARRSAALMDSDGSTCVASMSGLMSMTPAGDIAPRLCVVVSRSRVGARRVLRLSTRAGRSLVASADHRVRTAEGWRPLRELAPGDRVASARRVRVRGESQPLPRTHAREIPVPVIARAGRNYDAAFSERVIEAYQGGATVTQVAESECIDFRRVQHVLERHGVSMRGNRVRPAIPETTSPEFWRWMGYFLAEGCVERSRGCDKFWWVNSQETIRDDYSALTKTLFGLDARRNGTTFYVYSQAFGRFLEDIGLEVPLHAGNKAVPPCLFRCPDEEIAAFLSAYLDGDGHVSARQAEISAVTKSPRLARDLQMLFARLGVVAFVAPFERRLDGWTESRTYHRVTIAGAALLVLAEHLQFRHPMKARWLAEQAARLRTSKQPSNWDTVPWPGELVRAVRQSLGLTQRATGLASSMNDIENGYARPTPRIARQLLTVFRQAAPAADVDRGIQDLAFLAHEDLAWDEVTEVAEVEADAEDHLYDLTVPNDESFVGNGLVLHNCHIYTTTTGAMKNAFGGLLSTHRHYTHSWIHRTLVDLLAIQKEIHTGLFAVMDGTTAGNGPGPRTMFPVVKDFMLASADQVAIDAVAAKMMGFDPMSLEYISVAHADGLGVGDPRDIEVVGADVSGESWGFQVGDNAASRVGDLMWFGPLKKFQKLFFHTPLVNVFVLGSEVYHDYLRWPVSDRRTFERWCVETEWGRLFVEYGRRSGVEPPADLARVLASVPRA